MMKKLMSNVRVSQVQVMILCLSVGFGCSGKRKEFVEAEKLAHQYCQSCHAFPMPGTLNKRAWVEGVLPAMGPRLGIRGFGGFTYETTIPKQMIPEHAALKPEEWEKILRYYYSLAPDSLKVPSVDIPKNLSQFVFKAPSYRGTKPPVTTLVKIDALTHRIYVCDGVDFKIQTFNANLDYKHEAPTHIAVSSITLDSFNNGERQATLLNMGALNPNDVSSGSLQTVNISAEGKLLVRDVRYANGLVRPVFLEHTDLDQDGVKDYLICAFGNYKGELQWLKNKPDSTFEKNTLRNQPGAMQTMLTDFNKDGLEDIVALMAQGDEGIFLYENKGKGIFQERSLLRFSPVYGSTSFDLADFNNDGFLDIVYTSGDNSDYSRILKPYHGVYIFINDGHWNFKEEFFFAINGCFKVLARDFDQDGDLDLATISFFADLKNKPEEGFVYLQNKGDLQFEPHTFPQVMDGHWLTMDAGDLDADGDLDIVLGNMSIGPTNIKIKNQWKSGPPFVLLENKLR